MRCRGPSGSFSVYRAVTAFAMAMSGLHVGTFGAGFFGNDVSFGRAHSELSIFPGGRAVATDTVQVGCTVARVKPGSPA